MLSFLKNMICGRDYSEHLKASKRVRIHGFKFEIKKINPLSVLDGSEVLMKQYKVYDVEPTDQPRMAPKLDRIQAHMRDIFMAGVVQPVLRRKAEGENDMANGTLCVDHLFTDWDLANKLYEAIMEHTFGKKKFKRSPSSAAS